MGLAKHSLKKRRMMILFWLLKGMRDMNVAPTGLPASAINQTQPRFCFIAPAPGQKKLFALGTTNVDLAGGVYSNAGQECPAPYKSVCAPEEYSKQNRA